MTLHQLRIFLAVAQAATLTRASKQLGLAQPSLSKQLASLEESVGARLFERAHKRMVLTDAGRLLLFHAQRVIRGIDEAEAGLREFTSGKRAVIRIAGLNSVIKAIVPDALQRCGGAASGIEVDIHEAAPGEVVDMLYARQAHIGLIADGTITGGMIPKVETCIYALERGVEGVVILDGKVPHAVLIELLTDYGAGTLITR